MYNGLITHGEVIMKKIIFTLTFVSALFMLAFSAGAIDVNEAFAFAEFAHEETTLPYRIYIPEDYDENTEYPLVVFLHGAGERGSDNELQLKNAVQALFDRDDGLMMNSIVIAPQCPEGEQWVDTPWADGNYSVDAVPESNELAAVVALLSSLGEKYSIDSSRIYAIGVSMGGFGVWDLITRHNDIFAAAVPMCGGGDPSKASLLSETPIYTFHGSADDSVPFEGTYEMVSAIEDEGSRKINFVIYDGEGHGIWEEASAEPDWLAWIFEHKLTDRYPEISETEPATSESKSDTEIQTEKAAIAETYETKVPETEETGYSKSSENKSDSAFASRGIIIAGSVLIVLGILVILFPRIFSNKKSK